MEPHIIINADRSVSVPAKLRQIAVQYDHNIETVTFDCPRYWDGRDLSVMKVYINYMRADRDVGQYECKAVAIDTENPEIMHFDWVIEGHVTEASGTIAFLVCVKQSDASGNLQNRWSSLLNQEMGIKQGLNASNEITKMHPELITTILTRLSAVEGGKITLDTTLTASGQAADAKSVGDAIKRAINEALGDVVIEVDPTLSREGMAADAKAVGDKIANVPTEQSVVDKVMTHIPHITKLDFSNFDNGTWFEEIGSSTSYHSVYFDEDGRPFRIDDIEIGWG